MSRKNIREIQLLPIMRSKGLILVFLWTLLAPNDLAMLIVIIFSTTQFHFWGWLISKTTLGEI